MSEPVKPEISDESITQMQNEVTDLKTRLGKLTVMLHQKDIMIGKMAQLLEQYGINMIVLARNSHGILEEFE